MKLPGDFIIHTHKPLSQVESGEAKSRSPALPYLLAIA